MTELNSKPYVSVVVAARNDHAGGNMLARMQAFLDAWLEQAKRYNLASEVIVVEWNPPLNRPKLGHALRWPREMHPCEVRFIEVPVEVHRSFENAGAIPVHAMIARNIGIRRARGEFVLVTSPDIVFSPELMRFFAERRLEPQTLYRIDRHDVAGDIPSPATVDQLLAHCESHILRVLASEGTFEIGTDGQRLLDVKDIVAPAAGIRFGAGFYPVDSDGCALYRWLANEAEISFQRPASAPPRLLIDAETGPSAGPAPLTLQIADPTGFVLASASFHGRCRLRLDIPDQISSARIRLRIQSQGIPLERDFRFLNLRLFGLRWDDPGDSTGAPRQRASEDGVRVRSVQARQVQLELKPVAGAKLDSLEAKISDLAGNALFQMSADPLKLSRAREYLLTLDLGFTLSGGQSISRTDHEANVDPAWFLEVISTTPGTDWSHQFAVPSPAVRYMRNPAQLHTNASADFTLLSRDDWSALRGYAEFPILTAHIDTLLCYAAHHAGAREVVLGEPLRIFHIDHLSGEDLIHGGGVRELQKGDVIKWIDQMRRFNAPAIFTRENWGLSDIELAETVVSDGHLRR